jgi:hypothetical protein
MEYPEDPSQITATTLISVREHCHDASHFLTDHLFRQTKQSNTWHGADSTLMKKWKWPFSKG